MSVTLKLDGNQPQRRWTVALRIILAIPHWLFLALLSLVAFVVIFFAWFAVLFTAHMPRGMGDLLRRILQYQTRVQAYGQLLLTDRYPPWDVGPAEYPVELDVDDPPRFNRAAVLFRFFLQLPAFLLLQLVTSGLAVILVVVWLITLVSGRLPDGAYLAFASILRFQQRVYAFMGMLTSEYPGGLFGDRDDDVGTPTSEELPASPKITRLVLPGSAKALLAVAIVLGIGSTALNIATSDFDFSFGASAKVLDLGDDFDDAYEDWDRATRDCTREGASVDCSTVNASLRRALEEYQREVLLLEVPEDALDEGVAMLAVLDEMHDVVGRMSETSDPDEQLRLYFEVDDLKLDYDDAFDDFYEAVTF